MLICSFCLSSYGEEGASKSCSMRMDFGLVREGKGRNVMVYAATLSLSVCCAWQISQRSDERCRIDCLFGQTYYSCHVYNFIQMNEEV